MSDSFPCLDIEPIQQNAHTTIILLHGGSSNNESLRPLAPYFENFRLLLPQGTFEVGEGTFDWFRFADEQLTVDQDSLKESIEIISPFIDKVRKETDGNLVIAGISQGAIFAGELFFHSEIPFDGLMMLSGLLCAHTEHSYVGKRAFVAHGSHDLIVPIERATGCVVELRMRGIDVEFKTYEMGHDITEEEVIDAVEWLHSF